MKLMFIAATVATLVSTPAAEAPRIPPNAPISRLIENTFRNWTLEELPAAVRKTVQSQAAGHKISDIDREDRAGKTIWEVEFDGGKDGEDREIHIDNDGRLTDGDGNLLSGAAPVEKRPELATPANQKPIADPNPPAPAKQTPKIRQKWEDLPEPVKKAAEQFGGQVAVRDIDHEKREGREVWELEFERQKQNIELHFLADGKILEQLDTAPEKRTSTK